MGRNLKRVPLDFAWPLKTVWGGYLNPFARQSLECPDCGGTGSAPMARRFADEWYGNAPFDPVAYGAKPLTIDHPEVQAFARRNVERNPQYCGTGERAIAREARRLFDHFKDQWSHQLIQADVDALVAAGRLMDFTHRPRTEEQAKALVEAGGHWMKEPNGYTPTADEVNAWSLRGMGHDAINQWVCVKARCAREGVTETMCPRCGGDGRIWPTPEIKAAHETWTETDPPAGDGFQLWEDCSEGSPVSPVFATLDELCAWCETGATTFGSARATAAQWKEMLSPGGMVVHREGNNIFV